MRVLGRSVQGPAAECAGGQRGKPRDYRAKLGDCGRKMAPARAPFGALPVCDLSHPRSIVRDGNFVGER